MIAQEWLEELEQQRRAATLGTWKIVEDEDDLLITCKEREERIPIARIEYGSPESGMSEPFQPEQTANSAYIVAACNAMPKLVGMLKLAACLLECPHEDGKCPHEEDNTVSCAHCKVQRLYALTGREGLPRIRKGALI